MGLLVGISSLPSTVSSDWISLKNESTNERRCPRGVYSRLIIDPTHSFKSIQQRWPCACLTVTVSHWNPTFCFVLHPLQYFSLSDLKKGVTSRNQKMHLSLRAAESFPRRAVFGIAATPALHLTCSGSAAEVDESNNHQRSFSAGQKKCHFPVWAPLFSRKIKRGSLTLVACDADDGSGKDSFRSVGNVVEKTGHGGSHSDAEDCSLPVTGNGTDNIGYTASETAVKLDVDDQKPEDVEESQDECGYEECSVDYWMVELETAMENLEMARVNSEKVEMEAQVITERAISLRDQAADAERNADNANAMVDKITNEEVGAEEKILKAKALVDEAEEQVKQAKEGLMEVRKTLTDQAFETSDTFSAEKEEDSVSVNENKDMGIANLQSGFVETPEATADRSIVANGTDLLPGTVSLWVKEEQEVEAAKTLLCARELVLAQCKVDLLRIQNFKLDLQNEARQLTEAAKRATLVAATADEDVANIMLLAEQAVAIEVEATQTYREAEIALQKVEKFTVAQSQRTSVPVAGELAEKVSREVEEANQELVKAPFEVETEGYGGESLGQRDSGESSNLGSRDTVVSGFKPAKELEQEKPMSASFGTGEATSNVERKGKDGYSETFKVDVDIVKETDGDKARGVHHQQKKPEPVKDPPPAGFSKSRSSRFFSASYFTFEDDGAEFTPGTGFRRLVSGVKQHFVKLAVGILLLGGGTAYMKSKFERQAQLIPHTQFVTTIEEAAASAKPLIRNLENLPVRMQKLLKKIPHQEVNEEEKSLFDVLWLLLASVVFVPIFQKLPGGSPVLGYLAAGVLIGPYSLSIIQHVHGTKAIAEFGVVFLLFNIGLELSVERLSSMKKYVFGLGTSQVVATAFAVGLVSHYLFGFGGPAALVVGNGLALSSTAVVLQVLQERGESTSRHGRATFSVLLFQDLAVVVLLIVIPLVSPNSAKGGIGFQAIAEALAVAGAKAVVAIAGIIAGGRLLLRPAYKRMAENHNAEIFAANTLFVVLGTSVLTARAGLSMALGAFLAGLLLAETEYALQVESDIAPYRGLLLGLFFMTVGMSIDPKLLIAKFPVILGALSLLVLGKTFVVASVGRLFGLSTIAGARAGLLLAPGGEFAFVAFGEAVNQGIMTSHMSSLLFLVVGLSMALTPWLGALGQFIASQFEQQDFRSLLPAENETDDLQDHIIVCGFGRVGQIIAQLLSERLIPFVAVDVRSERVSAGRALDLPVYFGDAGSREVLHKIGAKRASCAVITLDTPGANYRTVWALSKHFPNVKTFVRAHDVDHGINLEKAGATAVVPETLEPSLQLAAAVLAQVKLPPSEIAAYLDEFRSRHLSELTELSELSQTSLGYGFSRIMGKPKLQTETFTKGKMNEDIAGEAHHEEALVA